jgi:hypothetical protein
MVHFRFPFSVAVLNADGGQRIRVDSSLHVSLLIMMMMFQKQKSLD